MMFRKILAFSLALILTACGIQPTPHPTPTPFTGIVRPIVIDTDTTISLNQESIIFGDPLAAAILTDNSLAVFEPRNLTVLEEESDQSGRTQASENGAPVRVAVEVEAERFEQLFLDTLNTPEK